MGRGAAAVALSTSKKCSEIETTITLPKKDADGKDYYDFILVGARPNDGRWYIEHYYNVPKDDLKDTMNTTEPTMGGAYDPLVAEGNDGYAGTLSNYNKADEYTWTVKVTQEEAGKYKIYINDDYKVTYSRDLTENENKALGTKKAYGQVFIYGNAPKGTKIDAKFASNKDKTVGLFADEE